MNTTQKALLALATAAFGVAFFEWRVASGLREQVRSLQEQANASAEHIQDLQRERDDAKSPVSAQAQAAAPKASQDTAELLGLRAEVARLRAEKPNGTSDAFSVTILAEAEPAARLNRQLALMP